MRIPEGTGCRGHGLLRSNAQGSPGLYPFLHLPRPPFGLQRSL